MTAIGDRVGHFRILGVLGRGGMGEVFDGFDETLQRRVALKTIHVDRRLDEAARDRFLREARLLSQLDHPAICRIYDYVEGDDCDLLALEMIDGRTLRDAIAAGLEFGDKLRIAGDVARALAAAHRLGIVHRDLKPDNIMLTAAGEVKILDFGLARTAGGPSEPPLDQSADAPLDVVGDADDTHARPYTPSPVIPHGHTQLGDVIGTPSYMSPEQARGEGVTTASDMFSLGLVLQTLFTGRRPHEEGIRMSELLARARRGAWLPVTGIDRDVAALIETLKGIAPSDRPTALDVVDRLEWIATRTRRTWRRIAAAAAVLAIALFTLKYVADVQRERNAAMQARAEADERRGQAEALIGFMVGDLRGKLEPLGRLDILDDVGDQALAYFRSLRTSEISAAEQRDNAKTLSQIGEVRMLQGNLAAAQPVLAASVAMASSAAARDPADAANQLQLGASEFWMGSLLRQQGDLEGALRHYSTYLELSEKLAARDAANNEYQLEVGYGHSNVGSVLEQLGDLETALAHYRAAVAIKERRLATDPKNADWNADFATTVNKVGVVLRGLGRYDEAEEALRRERTLLVSALEAQPDHARWRLRLAVNYSFLADIADERGDLEASARFLEEERAIESALVAHDPTNATWARSYAVNRSKAARLLHQAGRFAEAEAMLLDATQRIDALLRKDEKRALWRRDLARMHDSLTRLHLDRGNPAAARKAIGTAAAVLESAPRETETKRLAEAIAITRGRVLLASGDEAAARTEWNAVVESLWPLRAAPAASAPELDTLARALILLGRIDDARTVMERLAKIGYRKQSLVALWEERRNHQPGNAEAPKG